MGRGKGGSTSHGKRTPGGIRTSSAMSKVGEIEAKDGVVDSGSSIDTIDDITSQVEGFIASSEVPSHIRRMLSDGDWSKGECETISQELAEHLNAQGIKAEVVGLTGFKGTLDKGASADWIKFVGDDVSKQGFLWHAMVRAGDVFIDVTGSQYGEGFAGIRTMTAEQVSNEWEKAETHPTKAMRDAGIKKEPILLPKASATMRQDSPGKPSEPEVLYSPGEFDDEDAGFTSEDEEAAYKLAKDVDLGITRGRELYAVMKDDSGKVIGAAWNEFDNSSNEYSFDVAVAPDAQGKGLGSKLTDIALAGADDYRDISDDVRINVQVTSPKERAILEKRGLVVEKQVPDGSWMMTDSLKDAFATKHGFDPEEMYYLGKGDFGEAHSLGDGRVLKETSSRREFEIAQELVGKDVPGFAKIYVAEEDKGRYKIIMEELEEDSDIENQYYEVQNMLETQGLPIQYLGHFDEDEYVEEHGEIPEETKKFMEELDEIVSSYRRLGIEASDIRSENMGRDKDGVLKAFDLDDRNKKR